MPIKIDPKPDAEGVVYPDRENPTVADDATCQEVLTMIGGRYVRCGDKAVVVVVFSRFEIYYMCYEHADHAVKRRGGRLLAGEL
jgi:hypothetical protein